MIGSLVAQDIFGTHITLSASVFGMLYVAQGDKESYETHLLFNHKAFTVIWLVLVLLFFVFVYQICFKNQLTIFLAVLYSFEGFILYGNTYHTRKYFNSIRDRYCVSPKVNILRHPCITYIPYGYFIGCLLGTLLK